MTKKVTENVTEDGEGRGRHAALTRMLVEKGLAWEAAEQSFRIRTDRERHPYQLIVKLPTKQNMDCLMIVKVVAPDGPEIAFHSSRTMVGCVATYPARLNAGKVKWREDEHPPKKYAEIEAYVRGEVEYMEKFGW